MNDGKKTEKIVRLIHETLKNIPNTEIFSNYRIKNKTGRKREIDVLIKSCINNFDILIAIECKNHKRPISVEKVEAFNSKCERIKGISKKIFVSTNGYQANAIDAANDFDIHLYHLNDVGINEIINWLTIKKLKADYKFLLPHNIQIAAEHHIDIEQASNEDLVISFHDGSESLPISIFLWNSILVKYQRQFKLILLLEYMKNKGNVNFKTIMPLSIELDGIYVTDKSGIDIPVRKVDCKIIGWLTESTITSCEVKEYKNSELNVEARILSVKINDSETTDFIKSDEEKLKIFHTDKSGVVSQLKSLAIYNPDSDKLEFK